ncbi:hypothetical protein P691DRAFT_658371 [Macrolepiota fuliginosa MF-IS2]|uniref:C2H2-type domain-containing protein n=1 Tax=Macrolepiota fuliginosa MF-IS2 TaxID=1400762 RepID=A0A9P5XQN5_9AGAR|nr:hypothetical protein P691DRAFT_658371 [Macrolepiota fuliginosa MF-IS2]
MQAHSTATHPPPQWNPPYTKHGYLYPVAPLECADCNTECTEPACSTSDELTSQCTDQCVVIACSDPEHNSPSCDDEQSHCDFVCDSATDCSDCNGLDAFVRTLVFHHCFTDGLCPFTAPPQQPNATSAPSPHASPLACRWGNCQAQFSSLSELVGHVNLIHLHPPTTPELPCGQASTSGTQGHSQQTNENDLMQLPCLWGDCNEHLPPQVLSGAPSRSAVDDILSNLAAHLFQNHLGIHDFQSNGTEIPPEKTPSRQQEQAVSVKDVPLTPGEGHLCRWEECGMVFGSCNDLMSHMSAVHVGSGKPQYDCLWEGCTRNGEKGFSSRQKISRHLQSHTGYRPFQCPECLQNFSEAATLQQHIRRHTQESEYALTPYKCDFPGCGKSFAITGALTIHKRVHNGVKPFKCSYCNRGFAESSNLSKHLRTHTGERPYTCNEPNCGKAFARPDQLTRHMGVHRKKALAATAAVR